MPYKIGVIQLPSFYMDMDGARLRLPNYKSVTRDVRRLINDFNKQEVDMVLVDLRFNGGGSLTEAVNLTGLFIDKGPVVQVKDKDGRTQPYDDPEAGMLWAGPLVVITNKFSASASEIFAGAIQDYGRGLVIGDDATHGKGTVQQLFDLGNAIFGLNNQPGLGSLKLTIQQFYRPGGDSTQNRGVLADVIIPDRSSHFEGISESDLDYALKFDQVRPLRHDKYQMVDASLIEQLRQLSSDRITDSEDFARELKWIERYKEQKEQKTVTLNKEKYLKQRAELDADKETEEALSAADDPKRPVFKLDHYGKEALTIAIDYLQGLKENRVAVAHYAR
jgi:carboxyl-terminal processing protease